MPRTRPVLLAAAVLMLITGCTAAPSAARTACPSSSPGTGPSPRPAQSVDGGRPPPAPERVELTASAASSGSAVVRVVAAAGVRYESSELRVFVNGCRVPWTDEGDQLPTQTIDRLRPGDRVLVLARLNGEGGNSAETPSRPLTVP